MSHLPEALKVGVDSIDQRHTEFWALYEGLKAASSTDFLGAFEALILHTQSHFIEEEDEMALLDYPNNAEHKHEHQKALDEMNYFFEKAKSKRMVFAKAYVNDRLGDWFRNHLLNMDSDLARVITLNR